MIHSPLLEIARRIEWHSDRGITVRSFRNWALAVFLIAIAGVCALPALRHYELTGRFFPIRHIESLTNPIAIASWNQHELIAADNRRIKLPNVVELPSRSVALDGMIGRGVEVDATGRVIGLVHVIHGCGNDPVREHIARVDIADVLRYLGEGVHLNPLGEVDRKRPYQGLAFSSAGWEISEFSDYQHRWRKQFGR